jgi:hypothetical protein
MGGDGLDSGQDRLHVADADPCTLDVERLQARDETGRREGVDKRLVGAGGCLRGW